MWPRSVSFEAEDPFPIAFGSIMCRTSTDFALCPWKPCHSLDASRLHGIDMRWSLPARDKFGTFGRSVNFKNDKQAKKQQILDKVWVFAAHHKLESIKRRKFSTLEQERRHTVLNYLTSDRYVERELVTPPHLPLPSFCDDLLIQI
jgi:hypothetical protein